MLMTLIGLGFVGVALFLTAIRHERSNRTGEREE